MKKNLSLVCILAGMITSITLTIPVIAQEEAVTEAIEAETAKEAEDAQVELTEYVFGEFSAQIPEEWEMVESDASETSAIYNFFPLGQSSGLDNTFYFVDVVEPEEGVNDKAVATLLSSIESGVTGQDNVKDFSITDTNVADRDAKEISWISYSDEEDDSTYIEITYLLVIGEDSYTYFCTYVSAKTDEEELTDIIVQFDAIEESIQYIG